MIGEKKLKMIGKFLKNFNFSKNVFFALIQGFSRILTLFINVFITRLFGLEAVANFNSYLSANLLGADIMNSRKEFFYNTKKKKINQIDIYIERSFIFFLLAVFVISIMGLSVLAQSLSFVTFNAFSILIFLMFFISLLFGNFLFISGMLNFRLIVGEIIPLSILLGLIFFSLFSIELYVLILAFPSLVFILFFITTSKIKLNFKLIRKAESSAPWNLMILSVLTVFLFRAEDVLAPIFFIDESGYFVTARRICFFASFPLVAIFTFQATNLRNYFLHEFDIFFELIKKLFWFFLCYIVTVFVLFLVIIEDIYLLLLGVEYPDLLLHIAYLSMPSMCFPAIVFLTRLISITNLNSKILAVYSIFAFFLKVLLLYAVSISNSFNFFLLAYILFILFFTLGLTIIYNIHIKQSYNIYKKNT